MAKKDETPVVEPVVEEAPVVDPVVEPVVDETPVVEGPSAEEVAAENARVAAEVQAEEKAKFEAEEALAAEVPTPAANAGADIARAITEGLKEAKNDNFRLEEDKGVEHRFSLVKNKQGEVMLRENATGHLSKLQLESIEEKEASIQGQEVEEL